MYNTQQNEVEMVTAEGGDPNPNLGRGRRGPACESAPPPNPCPWILWYAPPTLPELDLPFPTHPSAHEVGASRLGAVSLCKVPQGQQRRQWGPWVSVSELFPNPQSRLPLEGKAGIPTPLP